MNTPLLGVMVASVEKYGSEFSMITESNSVVEPPSISVAVTKHSMSSLGATETVFRSSVAESVAVVVLLYTAPVLRLDHENSKTGMSPSVSYVVASHNNVSSALGMLGVSSRLSITGRVFYMDVDTLSLSTPP